MEGGTFEPEKDVGKAQFQQELNRWFESRGIIADLRSHLRHLMVTALQNNQVGLKAVDRNSPKAQALSLLVAEFLFKRGCHYSLSVFTSEVPSLVNFNPEGVLQGGRPSKNSKKRTRGSCFQEAEVEEIFNALGMSSREEELALIKSRYMEKGGEASLLELFLEAVVEMATKLQVRRDFESHILEGEERLLSEKWSSRVVNVLVGEKMTPGQVTAAEEAIFRITETEVKRILEEERNHRVQMLSEREKRIQEHLKKHEDEIFSRLTEAEKELASRKELIDEELAERERHITEMAVEWKNKHDEILALSKKFHGIETDNLNLQMKVKELEEENKTLKSQEETQTKTIDELRGEMNLLMNKLKEATDSNSALSERIQVLINRDNKEASAHQDGANQETAKPTQEEIPLLWSRKLASELMLNTVGRALSPRRKSKEFTMKSSQTPHPDYWNNAKIGSGDAPATPISGTSEDEDEDNSLSSSSDEIISGMRKKIKELEEETDRINQNYFAFKLRCVSVNSDSDSSRPPSAKSLPSVRENVITKDTKLCQTDVESTFSKMQKLTEVKEIKTEVDVPAGKKSEPSSPTKIVTRPPTKRQLEHRNFFLKSRELLQALEKQNPEGLNTSPSSVESLTCSSEEEAGGLQKKSPLRLTPLKSASICSKELKKPSEERKVDASNQIMNSDVDCLTLLEETRIKSPQMSARMPLRQQILLSETEEDQRNDSKIGALSPGTVSSAKMSVGKKSDGSW